MMEMLSSWPSGAVIGLMGVTGFFLWMIVLAVAR